MAAPIHAGQIDESISFQGRLTDEQGIPLASGDYILDFFFYEVRFAIEVDSSYHDLASQKQVDSEKESQSSRTWK